MWTTFVEIASKSFVFGCLGLLVEHFFTGIQSLLMKNWKLTTTSFLWMPPIYALGAWTQIGIHALRLHWLPMVFLSTLAWYAIEFVSAWSLQKIIGCVPWNYGRGKLTPLGYINLAYFPAWAFLALAFDHITDDLHKIFSAVFSVVF